MRFFQWLILLFFYGSTNLLIGQPPVEYFFADQVVCVNDTVRLPLQTRDFINVRNFQSSVRWNTDSLVFHSIEGIHPILASNFLTNMDSIENGGLGYFWLDNSAGVPLVLVDNSVLFVLKFTMTDLAETAAVGFGEMPTLTETVVENNGNPMQVSSTQIPALISKNEVMAEAEIQSATTTNNGEINLTVTNGEAPFSFLWSNGATTEDIDNLTANNYSVMITDAFGCTANFEYEVDMSTATAIDFSNDLIIAPNPTHDYLSIHFISTNENSFYQYKIYDLRGNLIFQKNNIHTSSTQKINLKNQPSGLYFLKIKTNKKSQIFKIIKK